MPKEDQFPVLIQEPPNLHDSDSGKYHINVTLQKLSFSYGRVNAGKFLGKLTFRVLQEGTSKKNQLQNKRPVLL